MQERDQLASAQTVPWETVEGKTNSQDWAWEVEEFPEPFAGKIQVREMTKTVVWHKQRASCYYPEKELHQLQTGMGLDS